MKRLGRSGRSTPGPELEQRLHDIFDDRRVPGAPEALYRYLGDLPMDASTEPSHGRFGFRWGEMGRVGRAAAALAVVAVVGAGLFAVTVGMPRSNGGSGSGATPGAIPTAPAAPAGWTFAGSFGSDGPDGSWTVTNLIAPAPRIAIHVVCVGFDDVIVQASMTGGGGPWLDGGPFQGAEFKCDPAGRESRVELTAQNGEFAEISAIVVRSPSSTVDTRFVVSIEVPEAAQSPSSPSAPPTPTPSAPDLPSISVSPRPS
jgi:hypothetical protein